MDYRRCYRVSDVPGVFCGIGSGISGHSLYFTFWHAGARGVATSGEDENPTLAKAKAPQTYAADRVQKCMNGAPGNGIRHNLAWLSTMCIAILTTTHPDFPLILINNRDEYLLRPTSQTPDWWQHTAILSSRDLQRPEHGTWLGVSRSGRLGVLTNFGELHVLPGSIARLRSRGTMVTDFLKASDTESTTAFISRLLDNGGVEDVGGFSLLCGQLRLCRGDNNRMHLQPLAVLSNRATGLSCIPWLSFSEPSTYGLSNAAYGSCPQWPKVGMGMTLLDAAVQKSITANEPESKLVDRLFAVLDTNTIPIRQPRETFDMYLPNVKESIFVPPITDENRDFDRVYGTQRQTVLLLQWNGKVTFVERKLWDRDGREVRKGDGDTKKEFLIQRWDVVDSKI